MSSEPSAMQVPPPKDWQVFERHLRDLLEAHWKSPATMHGRTGQPQHGVDIYGQPDGDAYHGVQCKGHDGNLNASVTETELKAEIGKAKKFTPRIAHFILATTAPRDAKIQAVVRRLNKRKTKPFPVEVLFWDDILAIYGQHPDVFHRHYPFVSPAPDRLHQLPAAPVDFTGRDAELAKLLDMIHTAGACITGLHGLGGVGKTALALVLAHQVKDAYPAAQLFVELHGTTDTPLPPADALKRAIQGFEPETKLPETAEELRPRYLSLLHGKKALILADNAAGPEHVRPLIPPPGCLLLVTSRRHFKVEGLFDLRLDTLPESDALKLLLAICDRIADHAGPIAKLCGYLPLALRAAASLLSVRLDIAVDAYVRDLADERTRLEKIGAEGVEIGVEASLNLSYRQLPPETARVFRLLSVFPATFDAPAEEQVCEDKAHASLGDLLRRSLVEFDEATQRYRLHDLVRVLAARRLDEPAHGADRLPAEQRHAEHYCATLAAADDEYLKGGDGIQAGLSLADTEWPNIQAGAAWARVHAERLPAALELASRYAGAGVHVLDLRLHPRRWADWLEVAIGAACRLGDRTAECQHLANLGGAYGRLGEPRRAIEFYKQALAIARALGDRRGEGATLGNLGNAYADLGEPRRAIEFYEQDLAIARAIGDRRGEGQTLTNLGLACADLGEPHRAIHFYEQRFAIARAIGHRRGQANASGGLGVAYAVLGKPRRAIQFYEEHRQIARAIGDRRAEAEANWNMGLAYVTLGDLPRAAQLMQVLVDYERELGHPDAEKHAAEVAALRGRVK